MKYTKLTCSVGVASNKLLAKNASSTYKPNGLLAIPEGEEAQFLAPLPISAIPGIGKKTALRMESDGFFCVHQLQTAGINLLMQLYGNWGYQCYQSAIGYDIREVQWEETPRKSIGAETTYEHKQVDFIVLKDTLEELYTKSMGAPEAL